MFYLHYAEIDFDQICLVLISQSENLSSSEVAVALFINLNLD